MWRDCVFMLVAPLHRDQISYQIDVGTSIVVFLFGVTWLFEFWNMVCSNLRHFARVEFSKSPSDSTHSTTQYTTILLH